MMNRDSRAYKLLVRSYQYVARHMDLLNRLAEKGLKPAVLHARGKAADFSGILRDALQPARPVESLERRLLMSITAALSGSAVTFNGTSADEHLYLKVDASNALQFSTDGTSYSSDLDASTSGVQSLTVTSAASITVTLGTGNNILTIDTSLSKLVGTDGATFTD